MFYQFVHPFSMIISGPSGSGKTTFLQKLLENLEVMISEPIEKIVWCYAERAAIPSIQNENISFHKGIPHSIENNGNVPTLVVLDDLMNDVYNSQISELFTKGSHHRNISVILVTQNLFHQGKHSRDISLNSKYLVVFKNPRDQLQFQYLAKQIYPENSKDLLKVYKQVTGTPHNYLLLDLTQTINDNLRFRSNIFEKSHCEVFCKINENDQEIEEIEKTQAFVVYS